MSKTDKIGGLEVFGIVIGTMILTDVIIVGVIWLHEHLRDKDTTYYEGNGGTRQPKTNKVNQNRKKGTKRNKKTGNCEPK